MVLVKDIMKFMEQIAPKDLAENWDNVGLMIGNENQEIKKVLVALDCTAEVIDEAIKIGANMIVTHHPFILFQKMKSITKNNPFGNKIYDLIQNNICVFSAHTNLDSADGGVNDVLANLFQLQNIQKLDEESGLGRIGELKSTVTFSEFAKIVDEKIPTSGLMKLVGDKNQEIKTVAVCGGSGASFVNLAKTKGADVYVTGDIKFHEAQDALDLNLCVADVTHYAGENLIVPVVANKMADELDVEVVQSKIDGQVFWCL